MRSNCAISNDLEWPLMQNSRSRYYSTLNISETVQDRDIVLVKLTDALLNSVIWNDLERPWVTARFSTTRIVARPLCDSWASCFTSWLKIQSADPHSCKCESTKGSIRTPYCQRQWLQVDHRRNNSRKEGSEHGASRPEATNCVCADQSQSRLLMAFGKWTLF